MLIQGVRVHHLWLPCSQWPFEVSYCAEGDRNSRPGHEQSGALITLVVRSLELWPFWSKVLVLGMLQEDILQSSWPIFQVLHVMSRALSGLLGMSFCFCPDFYIRLQIIYWKSLEVPSCSFFSGMWLIEWSVHLNDLTHWLKNKLLGRSTHRVANPSVSGERHSRSVKHSIIGP